MTPRAACSAAARTLDETSTFQKKNSDRFQLCAVRALLWGAESVLLCIIAVLNSRQLEPGWLVEERGAPADFSFWRLHSIAPGIFAHREPIICSNLPRFFEEANQTVPGECAVIARGTVRLKVVRSFIVVKRKHFLPPFQNLQEIKNLDYQKNVTSFFKMHPFRSHWFSEGSRVHRFWKHCPGEPIIRVKGLAIIYAHQSCKKVNEMPFD